MEVLSGIRGFGTEATNPGRGKRPQSVNAVWAHSNLASLRGGACVVRGVAQRANAGRLRGRRFSRPGPRGASRLAAEADDRRDAPRGEALRKRPLGTRRRGGMERGERAVLVRRRQTDRAMERQRRRGREGTPTRGVWSRASARRSAPRPPHPPAPDLTRGRRRFSKLGASNGRGRRPSVRHPAGSKRARARRATRDADAPSPPARADPTRADSSPPSPSPTPRARPSVLRFSRRCATWTRSSRRCTSPPRPPTGRRARRRRARSRRRAPTAPFASSCATAASSGPSRRTWAR